MLFFSPRQKAGTLVKSGPYNYVAAASEKEKNKVNHCF
ncbi:hypothetical protein FSS13T_26620 [Flavobacterium saliperosum S13]|uniref:Uncharacterized protein n=1 Tax=Flavobacterium saliperosum S13 TaxID=1341155 RepID=A0ABN0QDB6_9FLAO|nr:hypothetical protein FSS13T_26620 [Flavobacterium saliperosum S13]